MPRVIQTNTVKPSDLKTQFERDQVYNGLDCCVTLEVLNELLPQLDEYTGPTYDFSRQLQGPVLEMRLRGVKVDMAAKSEFFDLCFDKVDQLERNLTRIALEGVGMMHFNWRSNDDLKELFYDKLQIPAIKRGGRPTTNRNALEKLEQYMIARPIVRHLMAMRDIFEQIKKLKTEIDPDGRIRTSYNIAGTNTGRFSSSYSEFGTGGNLQNIEEALRRIFVADLGMKFAKFDAKSGESFCVGGIEWNLFKDARYLDACETGDPHTATARLCWPELPWTGNLKLDKAIAEQPFYRHYTYRFMCKKLGHGSNYKGTPATLSEQSRVPITVVEEFQPVYFEAFPAHLQWHQWMEEELWTAGQLVTLTGRKRQFWGRRNDPSTLREAAAYDPQGSLADIVNRALLNIWHERTAIIMMQDHDAITIQYPEDQEDEIIPIILTQLPYPVPLQHNRVLSIPYDCKVGWNRGEYNEKENPDGLKDYVPGDKRRRTPEVSILHRQLRR